MQTRIAEAKSDLRRLQEPDVLPVGTKVRLNRTYGEPKDYESSPGWRAYFKFFLF